MTTDQTTTTLPTRGPKRADAKRNYDKLLASAKAVFAEQGTDASLETIAEHAGVGIGTLYRNFPDRHALLEAVYLDEADKLGEYGASLADLPPWEAFETFMHRYVDFAGTKRALAEGLFDYVDRDDQVFQSCGGRIMGAGEPLLRRAQESGDVREDVEFIEAARMIGSISTVQNIDAEQVSRLVDLALDGLRYKA